MQKPSFLVIHNLINGLIDIIYPKTCVVCKTGLKNKPSIDDLICPQCWSKIKRNLPPFCFRCGRHLEKNNIAKNICPACIRRELHFDRAFGVFRYDGAAKELIHEFKYKGRDYLGSTLSKPMLKFIREYNIPMDYIDLIIPIPMHKARLREREFNQASVLGSYIAKEFAKEMPDNILIRNRYTRSQTELETRQRLTNVRGSFSVSNARLIKNKNILLVDDVLTTGATCSDASFTLKNNGANIVFAMTLAN